VDYVKNCAMVPNNFWITWKLSTQTCQTLAVARTVASPKTGELCYDTYRLPRRTKASHPLSFAVVVELYFPEKTNSGTILGNLHVLGISHSCVYVTRSTLTEWLSRFTSRTVGDAREDDRARKDLRQPGKDNVCRSACVGVVTS